MKMRLVTFFCALVSALCLTAGAGELDDLLTRNSPPAMSFAPTYYESYPCDYAGGGPPPPPWTCDGNRGVQACKDRCDRMISCTGPCADGSSDRCTRCINNLAKCKGAC